MKDQQIEKAMDGIENRIRHIYNCGYQQGYEDGKKNHEKVRNADMEYGYQRGLEDAWECVLKIGKLDVEQQKSIFGTYTTRQIALAFTVQQAMQKIKDYESTINYHDDFATALKKMYDYEERKNRDFNIERQNHNAMLQKNVIEKFKSCADMFSDEELKGAETVMNWIQEETQKPHSLLDAYFQMKMVEPQESEV